ncbi:MAG TPA: hypothetical protein PLO71_04055, partial [Thauera phenylacetica]|nr:hypothetical protein [Thauera phenylacetica]
RTNQRNPSVQGRFALTKLLVRTIASPSCIASPRGGVAFRVQPRGAMPMAGRVRMDRGRTARLVDERSMGGKLE